MKDLKAFPGFKSFISNVRVDPDKTLKIKVFVTRRAKSSFPNEDFGIKNYPLIEQIRTKPKTIY